MLMTTMRFGEDFKWQRLPFMVMCWRRGTKRRGRRGSATLIYTIYLPAGMG